MPIIYTFKNGSKAESAANTMTYDNVEVPESYGAKRVFVVRAEMDVSVPDYIAASQTLTGACLIAGKTAPSAVEISEPGAITSVRAIQLSTGAAQFASMHHGPDQAQGHWEVPRNAADNKFYITVGVKGGGNTNAKTVYYRVDFEVET